MRPTHIVRLLLSHPSLIPAARTVSQIITLHVLFVKKLLPEKTFRASDVDRLPIYVTPNLSQAKGGTSYKKQSIERYLTQAVAIQSFGTFVKM